MQKVSSATEIADIASIPDMLSNGTVVSEGKSSKTISADGTFALDSMRLKQYSGNRVTIPIWVNWQRRMPLRCLPLLTFFLQPAAKRGILVTEIEERGPR